MTDLTGLRFFLADELPITLIPIMAGGLSSTQPYYGVMASSYLNCMERVAVKTSCGFPGLDKQQRKALCNTVAAVFQNEPLKWNLSLQVQEVPTRSDTLTEFPIDSEFRVTFYSPLDIGMGLKKALGRDVVLQACLTELTFGPGVAISGIRKILTNEMSIPSPQERKIMCLDSSSNCNLKDLMEKVMTAVNLPNIDSKITGTLDLTLIVKGQVPSAELMAASIAKPVITKRILEQQLATDVVIVCSNDVEVKCHQSFLMAHSPVFQAMFQTDMQEANTRRVEWPDENDDVVKAFLSYLYHWDISKAEESCEMALDLLKMGHKYGMQLLENDMRNVFLSKSGDWYEMDVALKLFLFVHSFDTEWHLLRMKIVQELKTYAPTLQDSPTYQELIRQNPEAAMKLIEYSFLI